MFEKVAEADFIRGEHDVLRFWTERNIFQKLRKKNAGRPKWSFLDGPITANNPMGVHHAWGRTYKDAYQRFFAMTGHELRYQNGFDCQGLWVEVEVEKELGFTTKNSIVEHGIDTFVNACKQRVLKFAARQTEQSIRLGFWMDWDKPDELRKLSEAVGSEKPISYTPASGKPESGPAHQLVARLGNPQWGGSYFTFSTENNETIWTFLKKCFTRGKIYRGYDVMPWSGRGGSAYSQMEVADGRKLTVHKSVFVRFPIVSKASGGRKPPGHVEKENVPGNQQNQGADTPRSPDNEYLLVWTTTPWTLTSNVAAAVNPYLDYVKVRTKRDNAVYYFAKLNLDSKRLEKEFKEGFGRPEWQWPQGTPKLKTLAQIFKEQGGYEVEAELKGADMIGWQYQGPFDDLPAQASQLTDSEKTRFADRMGSFHPLIQSNLNGITTRATQDLQKIQTSLASTDWTEHGIAHLCADSNCHNFFESIESLMRPLMMERDAVIDSHTDPNAHTKVLLHLKDFGISTDVTGHIEKYFPSIEAIWNSNASPDDLNQVIQFIREQSKLADDIYQEFLKIPNRTAKQNHRVIRGGIDSKGNAIVTAGEGTGIVHIAPGCGDVDHRIGQRLWIPGIAPLQEDGIFSEGFGDFTGREAIDPETANLVFEKLREKHLLVAVEDYPHIYPHCWRTGDELVFRLVDEWFINMDWRQEIMEVTKAISWKPESIDGQNREIEWLTNMRDWMVSKKRFWGLALPIWIEEDNPDESVDV